VVVTGPDAAQAATEVVDILHSPDDEP
jgi:hypothetical protein